MSWLGMSPIVLVAVAERDEVGADCSRLARQNCADEAGGRILGTDIADAQIAVHRHPGDFEVEIALEIGGVDLLVDILGRDLPHPVHFAQPIVVGVGLVEIVADIVEVRAQPGVGEPGAIADREKGVGQEVGRALQESREGGRGDLLGADLTAVCRRHQPGIGRAELCPCGDVRGRHDHALRVRDLTAGGIDAAAVTQDAGGAILRADLDQLQERGIDVEIGIDLELVLLGIDLVRTVLELRHDRPHRTGDAGRIEEGVDVGRIDIGREAEARIAGFGVEVDPDARNRPVQDDRVGVVPGRAL
jgi:hypothetical protein